MTKPTTVEQLILFQNMSSLIFISLKNKGLGNEQIALLLENNHDSVVLELVANLETYVDKLLEGSCVKLDPVNEAWMMDIANRAVEANLTADGDTKYDTAQGFACAMEALRIATAWRGDDLNKNVDTQQEMLRKSETFKRARELYTFTNLKYGPESAARAAFDYILEQNDIAVVEALELSEDDLDATYKKIIEVMKD